MSSLTVFPRVQFRAEMLQQRREEREAQEAERQREDEERQKRLEALRNQVCCLIALNSLSYTDLLCQWTRTTSEKQTLIYKVKQHCHLLVRIKKSDLYSLGFICLFQVAVVAEADPERLMADTEAWRSRHLNRNDFELQKPLYSINTYTDNQVTTLLSQLFDCAYGYLVKLHYLYPLPVTLLSFILGDSDQCMIVCK